MRDDVLYGRHKHPEFASCRSHQLERFEVLPDFSLLLTNRTHQENTLNGVIHDLNLIDCLSLALLSGMAGNILNPPVVRMPRYMIRWLHGHSRRAVLRATQR